MNLDEFVHQIQTARWRIAGLQLQSHEAHQQELLPRVFEELYVAFEELQAAQEELSSQNEELLSTRQLIEAERRRYHDLFQSVPDGYLVTSIHGTIQEANGAAARMLGMSPQFLIGKALALFVADYSRRAFRADLRRLSRIVEPQEWELRLQPQHGAPFDAVLTVDAVRDWSGKAVALRWILRDISAHKQGEEWLRHSGSLPSQRSHMRSAAHPHESVPLADQAHADQDDIARQRLVFLNEATALLGSAAEYRAALASVADLAVPCVADWCAIDLIDSDGALQRLALAHTDPTRVALAQTIEQRYRPGRVEVRASSQQLHSDQSALIAEISDSLLRSIADNDEDLRILQSLGLVSAIYAPIRARGQTIGGLIFATAESGRRYDQSDLALAETLARFAALSFEQAQRDEQARAAAGSHEPFLEVMAQELKGPLSEIVNYAELLQRRIARGDTFRGRDLRGLRMLADQGTRLMTLVETLMRLSHMQSHQLSIEQTPVDLGALARQAVEAIQPMLPRHTLAFEGPDQSLVVEGDSAYLEQVIQHLIQNAIRSTPASGTITVRVEQHENHAQLAICDSGPRSVVETLMPLLQQTAQAGSIPLQGLGELGLGLYMVREIVALHGGSIDLARHEGQGNTFTVRLPLAQAQQRAMGSV